jgi:hypothetical protein
MGKMPMPQQDAHATNCGTGVSPVFYKSFRLSTPVFTLASPRQGMARNSYVFCAVILAEPDPERKQFYFKKIKF